ncbi:5-oxoprolinase subunit PxpA [Bacillus salitolerans]|uniref:5-oxoprolinase subunit A n=1 Tax=Bacillus salitolerans TaxID=1437434 RepID=A0ABW4LJ25_9BACI
MITIDINCDLGEGFGLYKMGQDDELLSFISSANIACGFHAGDPMIMNATIKKAKKKRVKIGAHPGFDDLHGFGRREMKVDIDEVKSLMFYQLGAIKAFCDYHQVPLNHMKPHGALYNMAATDPSIARAIVEATKSFHSSLIIYGLANSELIQACIDLNMPYAIEAFVDRTYQEDGTLTPRSLPFATIHSIEESVNQALSIIIHKKVKTASGKMIPLEADTFCIHGDHENSVELASALRKTLIDHDIIIRGLGEQS